MLCAEGSQLKLSDFFVNKQKDLDRVVSEVTDIVGIDTEFVSRRTFFRVPCLLQLATSQQSYVIDLVAPLNLESIEAILKDASVLKVMHATSEDLRVLYYLFGEVPDNVVDTQIACGFVAQEDQPPYQRMVKNCLGIELDKAVSITTSNWLKRPLSAAQLRYAREDVRYLLPVWFNLLQQLRARGRESWFLEEMRNHLHTQTQSLADGFGNQSGSGKLSVWERLLSTALIGWRESVARRANLPRQWVTKDEHIIAAVKSRKQSVEQFMSQFGPKQGKQLHGAIHKAAQYIKAGKTSVAYQNGYPWSTGEGRLLHQRMREVVRQKADQLDLSRRLLATQKDVFEWAADYLSTGAFPKGFGKWREPLLGNELKASVEELQ